MDALHLHGNQTRKLSARMSEIWATEITLSPGLLLGGILLLAAILRFGLLDQNSIWFDEAFVASVASHGSWTHILATLKSTDAHPPLYYLFMKLWIARMGTGEFALRAPSAFFSLLSVLATYLLARRMLALTPALLATFFVSVAPLEIIAGQEARMYPLLQCLTLASTLALLACVEHGGAIRWGSYVSLATAMAYTHYLGILVILAQGLWIALFSRIHLLSWLCAASGIVGLYVPWLPSLWYQTVNGHGWAWYRPQLSWQAVGDLGGLYAFGGSLFGMGDYFIESVLSPLDQLIILLPFLTLLAIGSCKLRNAHKQYWGLVTFLLAIPIGVPLVISLARPMFYPRWFSFLFPAYAITVAAGIFGAASLFKGRKDRMMVFLTIVLLLYNVPALARHYLDPASRLYNWRGAAELVAKNIRSGDLLLYTNDAARISFRYYFRSSRDALVLTPIEAIPGRTHRPTFTPARAQQLATKYSRLWVIATPPFTPAMQNRLRNDLEGSFQPVDQRNFGDVWVTLLEAKHASRLPSASKE
jgi:mannosyltransferase